MVLFESTNVHFFFELNYCCSKKKLDIIVILVFEMYGFELFFDFWGGNRLGEAWGIEQKKR